MEVVGLDACRSGWVGVVLEDGVFAGAVVAASAEEAIASCSPTVVGVDIPIGTTAIGRRACDVAARVFVGPRRHSVFPALPTSVMDAADYAEAAARCVAVSGQGLSKQSWVLVAKTREVAALRHHVGVPVHEVHPEVSFRALAGEPLRWAKTTWNGLALRRRLLAEAGIVVPDDVGAAGAAGPDDVLDAAVVAWSAARIAAGTASSLPDPPEDGIAIWY
ncbi:MAG: DUF429 domain-containing protein [Actinobacteria bacterium]|nr:DUF429 domain-containing protein [Actinomycetota bacterium]